MESNLSRVQKRAKILDLYCSSLNVLGVCADVHSSIMGASDPALLPEELNKYIEFLEKCLETWVDNYYHGKEYDDGVKNLIVITIKEAKGYISNDYK